MDIKIETVTPERAKKLLETNPDNRSVSRKTVDAYSRDMAQGKWLMTGEAIQVNCDGTLLNGQHRLHACVKSNSSFTTVIAYGIQADAMLAMDTGRKRTFSDMLTMRGIKNATVTAGITMAIHKITTLVVNNSPINNQMLFPIFKEKQAEIEAAASRWNHYGKAATPSVIGALIVLDAPTAERFATVMDSGVPAYEGCAAHVLREKLIASKNRHLKPTHNVMLWTTIHAYNLFKDEQPVAKMQWHADAEKIIGLKYSTK